MEIKIRTEYVPENAEKVDHRHGDPSLRGKIKLRRKAMMPEDDQREHEAREHHPKKAFTQIAQQGKTGGKLSHASGNIGCADVAGPGRPDVNMPQRTGDDKAERDSADGVRAEGENDGPGNKRRGVDLSH